MTKAEYLNIKHRVEVRIAEIMESDNPSEYREEYRALNEELAQAELAHHQYTTSNSIR